jgi:hypothetical protein
MNWLQQMKNVSCFKGVQICDNFMIYPCGLVSPYAFPKFINASYVAKHWIVNDMWTEQSLSSY